MAAKFVIKGSSGQFYFNLVTDDGKKLLGSEMHLAKSAVFEAIALIKLNASEARRYDKLLSIDGKAYFTLRASAGQILSTSDMFDDDEQRDQVLSKVMHGAPEAAIVEAAPAKKTKAELVRSVEARKLNRRTMRAIPSESAVIRSGAILQHLKEEDRRLLFEYMGEMYETDLARAKGAWRMVE